MTLSIFIKIIIFLFPLAYSPGPGNLFFAINGARFGYRRTMRANFGYHLATWIVTYAIGLVFLGGVTTIPNYIEYLKYFGSLYIAYLAYSLFRAGAISAVSQAKQVNFVDGVLLLTLNPKAYVIIILLFTQFMSDTSTSNYFFLFIVTSIFTLNNFIAFSVWAIMGDILIKKFRSTSNARLLNKLFGGSLFLVGIWILLS